MDTPKLRFKDFTDSYKLQLTAEHFTHIRNGFVGTATPYYTDERGIKYLQSNNIKNGTINENTLVYITEEFHKKNSKSILKTNDVLMVQSGHAGDCAVVSSNYDGCNCHALIVMTPKESIDSTYYMYYLHSPNGLLQVNKLITGNTIKHILASEVKNIVFPYPELKEQQKIANFFSIFDKKIQLQQEKIDLLEEQKKGFLQKIFPKDGDRKPEYRFKGFINDWEEVKLGQLFEKVSERNDGSFNENHWISVAKMYFQDPEKVQSNNIDTRTYVMREGDIAFEGHPNKIFKFGRFVVNDIGPGVVSELFPIYRHKLEYDNNYWKNFIQLEHIMAPIFAKSITSSGNSSNKLDTRHFLKQKIYVAPLEEQKKIGSFFKKIDAQIQLQKQQLEWLQKQKQAFMQQMFI